MDKEVFHEGLLRRNMQKNICMQGNGNDAASGRLRCTVKSRKASSSSVLNFGMNSAHPASKNVRWLHRHTRCETLPFLSCSRFSSSGTQFDTAFPERYMSKDVSEDDIGLKLHYKPCQSIKKLISRLETKSFLWLKRAHEPLLSCVLFPDVLFSRCENLSSFKGGRRVRFSFGVIICLFSSRACAQFGGLRSFCV